MRNITKESEQRHGVAAGKRALARKEGREEGGGKKAARDETILRP